MIGPRSQIASISMSMRCRTQSQRKSRCGGLSDRNTHSKGPRIWRRQRSRRKQSRSSGTAEVTRAQHLGRGRRRAQQRDPNKCQRDHLTIKTGGGLPSDTTPAAKQRRPGRTKDQNDAANARKVRHDRLVGLCSKQTVQLRTWRRDDRLSNATCNVHCNDTTTRRRKQRRNGRGVTTDHHQRIINMTSNHDHEQNGRIVRWWRAQRL